jgi:lipopolysaccharide export LptBFGC system permease protein LptF
MVTLHAYILRELLRNFALTVLALTALFTMGGGLYNVVRYEGVTAGDVFGFLPLLLPIVVTLTMPLAALFAATMVYGRLAADNELLACRAAGINVHWLLTSGVLLAVFVALFTLVSGNYVIPDFMRRLDYVVRANVRDLAFQQLRLKGHLRQGNRYFVTAEEVLGVPAEKLAERDFPTGPGYSYIYLTAPTFLQLDDAGRAVRFTAAEWGLVQFDTTHSAVQVSFWAGRARDFEVGRRAVEIDGQKIGSAEIPIEFPNKPSWQDLRTLVRWRNEPWQSDKLARSLDQFRFELLRRRFFEDTVQRLSAGEKVELLDDGGRRYELSAARAVLGETGNPVLGDAQVRVFLPGRQGPRDSADGLAAAALYTRYVAPRAELLTRPLRGGRASMTELRLLRVGQQRVQEYPQGPGAAETGRPASGQTAEPRAPVVRESASISLDGLQIPEPVRTEAEAYAPPVLLNPNVEIPMPGPLADRRAGMWAAAAEFQRKVTALIHFRIGYSLSPLVTVVLGAALGVIFRGGRALAAFGLACVPFGTVTVLMIMGRNLAQNATTEQTGAVVIWGGLVALVLANLAVIRLGVQR